MKKTKLILSILIFFLSSCNGNTSINQIDDFKYIEDMNLENMTISFYEQISPSENGIYYILGNYIYFYDFESNQHVLLCNKPNCKHNLETDQLIGQECNAYLKNATYGGMLSPAPIIYSNHKLYMEQQSIDFQTGFSNGYDIVQIEQDGSNRKILVHSDEDVHINTFRVHQNALYYVINNKEIYKLDLNDNNAEPIELLDGQLNNIYKLFCKDNYLYLSAKTYKDKKTSVEHFGVYGRLNLRTNEFEIIKENEGNLYFALLDDNKILFTKNYDTYVFNMDTKEEIYLSKDSGMIHNTEKYIFVVNGPNDHIEGSNTIEVYDKKFNYIDSIELEEGMKHCTSGAYNNQLFVLYYDLSEESNIERLYTIYVEDNKLNSMVFREIDASIGVTGYQWNVNDYK